MTKEEFIKGLKFLGLAYNKEFTNEQASVWYDFFKDETYDDFRQAIKRVIPQENFIPSIARIKEELAYIKTPLLQLDPSDEWDKVLATIRKYGRYREKEALESMDERNANILNSIGGMLAVCNATKEDLVWLKKEFVALFNNSNARYDEAMRISNAHLTLGEIKKRAEIEANNSLLLETSN